MLKERRIRADFSVAYDIQVITVGTEGEGNIIHELIDNPLLLKQLFMLIVDVTSEHLPIRNSIARTNAATEPH